MWFFKSFFKLILWSFVIGFLLLGGILWYFPQAMEQKALKTEIAKVLSAVIHADVVIDGPVTVSLVPDVLLKFSQATITKHYHGGAKEYKIDSFSLSDSFTSLLVGRINTQIDTTIDGSRYQGVLSASDFKAFEHGGNTSVVVDFQSPEKFLLTASVVKQNDYVGVENLVVNSQYYEGKGQFYKKTITNGNGDEISKIEGKVEFEIFDLESLVAFAGIFSENVAAKKISVEKVATSEKQSVNSEPVEELPFATMWGGEPFDVSWMAENLWDITLKAREVKYKQSNLANLDVQLLLNDKKLLLSVEPMNIYGGVLGGKLSYNSPSVPPVVALKLNAQNLAMGDVFKDIGLPYKASGGLSVSFDDVSAKGETKKDMVGSLNGVVQVDLKDVLVEGVDSVSLLNRLVQGAKNTFIPTEKAMLLSEASATFVLRDGVVNNDNLNMAMSLSPVHGRGFFDMNTGWIKYRVIPKIVGVGQVGLKSPILIKGDIRHPKYKLDVAGLITKNIDQLGGVDNKHIQKILQNPMVDEVKSKIESMVGEGGQLHDFFKSLRK